MGKRKRRRRRKAIKEGKRGVGRRSGGLTHSRKEPTCSSSRHSERCFNPIPFICGVGCGPLLFEPSFLPSFLRPFIPRGGRTVVSNELATVHFTPTVKICGRRGKSDGHPYPAICRSTRPHQSPPTRSLAKSGGATEYLVRWHAPQ